MTDRLNDISWETIFKDFDVLQRIQWDGLFEITSRDINRFRQARLMAKFDHKSELPAIFKKHKLAILPISRGAYVIGKFHLFKNLPVVNSTVFRRKLPLELLSIDIDDITSEAVVLNSVFVSDVLASFIDEGFIFPTSSGRQTTCPFELDVLLEDHTTRNIKVNKAQIEVDGVFESQNSIVIIEAKNKIVKDFNIRQLYYPYRHFMQLYGDKKKIVPVYLTYANGVVTLYECRFTSLMDMNSIIISRTARYSLTKNIISRNEIQSIIDATQYRSEPLRIPFPQADTFERLISICEFILKLGRVTKQDITSENYFDERQTMYYTSAAMYLGLVQRTYYRNTVCFTLTDEGKRVFELDYTLRNRELIKMILSHRAFSNVMKALLISGEIPEKVVVASIMKNSGVLNLGKDSTYLRRASTITNWIHWIMSNVE